jgi:DNA-binding NtrC family response regulator
LFQAADRGTLFLDEIGCLTPSVQVKILKAIEERTVRPVGGRADRAIDIQIIAATNGNLENMVRDGMFREDLFYRLRVAALTAPPLRDRGADIAVLAHKFVSDFSANYRLPTKTLSPDAQRRIASYQWPGNVRELRNTLDRAVLFSDGPVIDVAALGLPDSGAVTMSAAPVDGTVQIDLPADGVRLEEVERSLIMAALRRAQGNQSAAARLLGLTRDTLRYRMEKFGIEAEA